MSRTFADLIKSVSRNVGDLYDGTLTGATNATTLLDSGRTQGDGWWTGGNIALVTTASALNAGKDRNITGFTTVGGSFFTDSFPAVPSAGDTYEIRRRPKHTRGAVKEFLNQAVRECQRQSWVAVDSVTDLGSTLVYAYGRAMYPVPASIEMVNKILYQDINDAFGNLPWYELDQDRWQTNTDGNVLIQQLADYSDWDRSTTPIPDGAPLRFMGSKRPTEFVNDTDVTPFEGNYLEVFATARLCLRLAEGAQDEVDYGQRFQMYYKLETDAFRGTRRGLPSGSRKVQP